MHIHNQLRSLRRERGLTQKQLADQVGVNANTVSLFERGASESLRTARLLADFFGYSITLQATAPAAEVSATADTPPTSHTPSPIARDEEGW